VNELERIALLRAHFSMVGKPEIRMAIGDDAAVLDPPSSPLVWTIDAQVEGTHFRLDWLGWYEVGWRSFMAAASDLAAMGASPLAALSALALSPTVDDGALEALAAGQRDAAREVGAPIIGGNLVGARETSVTTTLLGTAERPILRRRARPGDALFLGGSVGLAAAGLSVLERSVDLGANAAIDACVAAWRRPRARIDLGLAMYPAATAAIDVSDGLACDAFHMATASGVVLALDQRALLRAASPALAPAAAVIARDVLDLTLYGGEDYALLVASPAATIDGFARVGVVEEGEACVVLQREDGAREPLAPRGFDHFAEKV
jgi:thiamine-monophosphate kinase